MKSTIEFIHKTLLEEWDPIGVRNIPEARDEYSQYVSDVYHIAKNHDTSTPLFDYLWNIETEYMGLKGNMKVTTLVAEKIFNHLNKRNI